MAARTQARAVSVKLGAAFTATLAASTGYAECRAAPEDALSASTLLVDEPAAPDEKLLVPHDKVQQAAVQEAAALLVASAHSDLLSDVSWSVDGSTPWLGLGGSGSAIRPTSGSASAFDFESFVMLAADMATDPAVQRAILARENQLQRCCLSASDSLSVCASDLDDWSTEGSHVSVTARPSTSASASVSVCGSDMLIVENQALREENASLKAELRRSATPAEDNAVQVRNTYIYSILI